LKLRYYNTWQLLVNFAFKFNFRRYNKAPLTVVPCFDDIFAVWRRRLTISKPVLKAPMV